MKGKWKARQPLTGVAVCAAVGIGLAEYLPSGNWMIGVGCALIPIAFWLMRTTGVVLLLTGTSFFALHWIAINASPGLRLSKELGAEICTVDAQGVVLDEPEQKRAGKFGERSTFRVQLERIMINGTSEATTAPILVVWRGKPPVRGDLLSFTAEAHKLAPPRNPGQFNQSVYYNRQGIFNELRVRYPMDGRILSSGHGNRILAWADQSRHWMQRKLTFDLEDSPEVSGVIQSLVLGLKDATPEETRELFQRTGTMHLFVVNGLHIGLFAAIIWNLLKPVGVTRRRAVFVILPLITFYALVTGLTPGSIRATLMAAVLLGGYVVERRPIALNSLAAAALAILLGDTNQLFRPGFQFSFGVVASILLLASPFRKAFARFGQPDVFLPRLLWNWRQSTIASFGRTVAGLCAVSISAWLGSIPFTIGYFHLLSISAILANLLIVPTAFVILGQGILAMSVGSLAPGLGSIFTNANWAAVKFLLYVVGGFAAVPGGHLYLQLPLPRPPDLEMTVFDFGRGNAIHVRSEGRDWLFDTGNTANFRASLLPYLRSKGTNRLDGLLLSHGHIANVGAALEAVDEYHPKLIVDSPLQDRSGIRKQLHDGLEKRNLTKCTVSRGDTIPLSKAASLRILFPPPGQEARTADSRSLVVRLEIPGHRILFLFDSGYPTEEWLLENEPDLKCDLLIKGMHSDEPSGIPAFLAATHPKILVCGSGGNVGFSRISEEWAASVGKAILFRQDLTGAVSIRFEGETITAQSYLGNQKYP